MKRPRSYAMTVKQLEELFGLDRESIEVCEFFSINRSFETVKSYFEDNLQANSSGRFSGYGQPLLHLEVRIVRTWMSRALVFS
jgi:hypothetical protein